MLGSQPRGRGFNSPLVHQTYRYQIFFKYEIIIYDSAKYFESDNIGFCFQLTPANYGYINSLHNYSKSYPVFMSILENYVK
jgi:hypothetical protein